jgi:protein ImuA
MGESREYLRELSGIAAGLQRETASLFALGHAGIDALFGGGLARGRLHEVVVAEAEEASSGAGFAAMLALRAGGAGSSILWLRTEAAERRSGGLYAPGLLELGVDPDALLLGVVPDDVALLRSAADAARCSGLGALVIESWGNPRALDLTASRRLVLAAERSGVTLLLLRIAAEPAPNAADTRWAVRAAPSLALEANAPGAVMLEIELLRRRSGPAGMRWRVEWDRDEQAFREPALSGAMVSLSARRPAENPRAAPLRRTA